MKHPHDAFVDQATIATQWQSLGFSGAPDLDKAAEEFDAFASLLRASGADVELLPRDERTTLDSIYVRDATIVCDRGVIV